MVVWVYAGGGDTEIKGLFDFLRKQYKSHTFQRESPARKKPRAKPCGEKGLGNPRRSSSAHGMTGESLARQIETYLSESLNRNEKCDLILVVDDLDCHDTETRSELFLNAIERVEGTAEISCLIAFASPEIEAWIIADWDNTVAKDVDFRGCHQKWRHWLSTRESVPFDRPEKFSQFDQHKNSCREKLSDAMVKSSLHRCDRNKFSKVIHTARFLGQIAPEVVSGKCPLFRELHTRLSQKE